MYILPQVQVFQEFRVIPTTVVQNLNAFIFGANYRLFRYSVAAEKAYIGLGQYDRNNETVYPYPNKPADTVVDTNYVKLYMENVWAQYITIAAAASNPLNVLSDNARNKLRAAPVIGAAAEGTGTDGVTMDSAGFFVGGVSLPESYYFFPTGGAVAGVWSASGYESDLSGTGEGARLRYVSSEDLAGNVDIADGSSPLVSGNYVVGPDGLQLDLDSGTDDKVRQPIIMKFCNAASTSYFTAQLKTSDMDVMRDAIDASIDTAVTTKANIDNATGGGVVATWTPSTRTLLVTYDATADTLQDVYNALVAVSAIATNFTVSAITGTATNLCVDTEDEAGASMATGLAINIMPDCYRIRVSSNPYTFKTGNGTSHSAHFKTRGVVAGDRVRYAVTVGAQTYTGTTKVVSFEADKTLAQVIAPDPKSTNAADQVGTVLSAGVAMIAAGTDNQRTFDDPETKLYALDAVKTKYTGDLLNGLVADNYTVEIIVPGVAGVAQAIVSNDSNTYYRENVLIEAAGAHDGRIYIGRNMYINFKKAGADPDAEFQVGDTYTFSTDVLAPFAAVDSFVMDSAGTYEGTKDTTYVVEVTRGGVFDRAVNAIRGVTCTTGATLVPSVDWASWTGGQVNDEYVLRCIATGTITTAEFTLESQRGDVQALVQFSGTGTDVALGSLGLEAQITEVGGPLTYTAGDYWVIKLNGSQPLVRITDTAGVDEGSTEVVAVADDFNLGQFGATMTFNANTNTEAGFCANGGLLKGDVFYVKAYASANSAIRTLVLADDLPAAAVAGLDADDVSNPAPSNFGVWLYLVQTSALIDHKMLQTPPDYNWTATAANITVAADIAVQDASWVNGDGSMPWLPIYSASLFSEYRVLLATYTDSIHLISDIGDVEAELGTITPANPLAQGVYNALSNSGNRGVYYMAVPTDDQSGYLRVLDRASLSDTVYGFVPLTQDRAIHNAVEAHINSMSSETNKRWRIGFVGTATPVDTSIYDKSKNPAADEFYALVSDDPLVVGAQYTVVTFVNADGDPSPYTQVLDDVKVGDKVRINYSTDAWGDSIYEEYEVASLVSNTQLKLVTGPSSSITLPTKVEVWHDYSVQEMAEAVAAISTGYGNRRIYHVFPSVLGAYGVQQTSEFGAAAVAGLNSSVVPQQGLTNIELNGFDDLPLVYSTFSQDQLNTMAGAGTLIIMQNTQGGRVYIRHQVSTAAADGNLNTTELSVTKNLDSISYYFAGRLAPFIGRYNVTPELLVVLRTQIEDGLLYLGSFTSTGLLGPQVILAGSQIRAVEQHPTLRDHVVATVDLQLPYPLNVIELHLVV